VGARRREQIRGLAERLQEKAQKEVIFVEIDTKPAFFIPQWPDNA
jgi:hypothetical protein